MRMQHVVAVGDLKFPEGVVATVLSVVTSKVHLKGTGTKVFFFVFVVYCCTSIYCTSEW